ncbi:hypothetical protein ACVWV0_001046 [Ewingella americana]
MSIPTLRSLDLPAAKKTQDSKGFRLKPFGPVCVATQGFTGVAAAHDLDLKVSLRGNARFQRTVLKLNLKLLRP